MLKVVKASKRKQKFPDKAQEGIVTTRKHQGNLEKKYRTQHYPMWVQLLSQVGPKASVSYQRSNKFITSLNSKKEGSKGQKKYTIDL